MAFKGASSRVELNSTMLCQVTQRRRVGGVKLYDILSGYKEKPSRATERAAASALEALKEPTRAPPTEAELAERDTPHVKKRHRRAKSSGLKKDADDGRISFPLSVFERNR